MGDAENYRQKESVSENKSQTNHHHGLCMATVIIFSVLKRPGQAQSALASGLVPDIQWHYGL